MNARAILSNGRRVKKMAAERYVYVFGGPYLCIHFPHYDGKTQETAYDFISGNK
jgi:hypothetical protein